MEQIIEYGTLAAPNDAKLVSIVNDAIASGWQPIGGIAFIGDPRTGGLVVQAMVKYTKTPQKSPKKVMEKP